MKRTFVKKAISIFLAVVISITATLPAVSAFAGDGVEGQYDLQIFDGATDTVIPSYQEDGVTEYVVYMTEGDERQFTYKLIDSSFPDNGYVKWFSEAPALADVDQTGKVKAFDSSKGAVIHLWIDNEVKTIPLLGKPLGALLEKAFFNEYVDIDSMDTDEIVKILEDTLGSNSWIAEQIESYKGELIDSLREYLDKVNSNVHCVLYNKDGEKQAEDVIKIVVKKCEEWYAAFLPNGTHITNKSQIPDTVAKGGQVQLHAITTPQRLHFGTVYSVKSSSILSQGKVVATVDDSGLVKFKNVGTATIMVSPDSDDVIQGLLKFINYFYELQHTGTIDSQKAADIIIKYIGLDINRNVLAAILDACFAISDIVGDAADPVQLTATAVKLIANLCLQFAYNDTIDFTVVPSQPIKNFDIEGLNSVKEGQQIQLAPTNIDPAVGDPSDIVWTSENPSIACVDRETGIVTGLDAGGSLGSLSSQSVVIHATSTTNNVDKTLKITVTGKTGKYISKADIKGKSLVGIEETENFGYTVYPKRVAEGDNLYIKWGMVGPEDEDGNPTYIWADDENEAVDPHNVGKIDSKGHFTPLNGGKCKIALEVKTGYSISDGSFYEISSYIAVKEVETGVPVEKIDISVTKALGLGNPSIGKNKTVTINGKDYYYCTEKIGLGNAYNGRGTAVTAKVYPENATYQNVKWVVNNSNFDQKISEDTHTNEITVKPSHETTQKFDVYAVSADGEVLSNVITVCITRNYATGNKINEESINLINGKTGEATHTMTFDGTLESSAYACYDANWYSTDEEVFTVENKGNDNSDAVLTAHDVGTAFLYCVSADGAYIDKKKVTVRPDKQTLSELVNLCEKTVVLKTKFNKDYYKDYCRKLSLAYIVLYEEDMASQNVVDTTAANLLAAFTKIGGFVSITDLQIKGTNGVALDSKYVTIQVGATKNYKNYSYDFDYKVNPKGAMYSKAEWSSSNDSVTVDENGICRPSENKACAADITCSVTDYSGTKVIDIVHVAFARTKAIGVEIKPNEITEAKIGETKKLEALVSPKSVINKSEASVGAVTWRSTNEKVCTVDEEGVVSFLYGGNARVVATTADGGFTAECKITVTTNYDKLKLLLNQLDSLVLDEKNYYPETWAPYVAEKEKAEYMIANKGFSQEEVDAQYEKLDTAHKNLKKYVDIKRVELYLDGEQTKEFYQYDLNLLTGGWNYTRARLDLKVRIYPNNATYQKAEWFSSTQDISVSSDGVCSPTANKPCYGEIKCVVTDAFGVEFYDTVWVSFSKNPVTGIRLSDDNITGSIGEQKQIFATIEPVGSSALHINAADIQDYYWESDDENIATIDKKTGVITFVSAGSTVVRCVSYDGGIYSECKVSTEGDRTALKEAIQKYENVDYTQYEYEYGMAFKSAYEHALDVLNDKTMSQEAIDDATVSLTTAGEALAAHPYISVEAIDVKYETYKLTVTGKPSSKVANGTVGSYNAVSVDLSKTYESNNSRNSVVLTASTGTPGSMYKSFSWMIDKVSGMNTESAGETLTLKPDSMSSNAWAKVRAVYTDHYGKTTEREIWITMADVVCTELNVSPLELNLKGTSEPYQLNFTTKGTGTGYIKDVVFASDNEEIAKVSKDGVVTPVNAGECNIIVKTLDGGYTQKVVVRVTTDFSELAQKVKEYEKIIEDTKDTDQYTEESRNALIEQVNICKEMINDGKANQSEVNEALRKLNEAYGNLSGYIPAIGINIFLNDSQNAISEVNPGFVRYKETSLNGASINFGTKLVPENGMFKSIKWTSSNSAITVNENGLVTNSSLLPGCAKITATVTNAYGDSYSNSVYVSFVRNAVKSISFENANIYGAPNKQKQITPVLASDSSIKDIPASVTDCLYESMNTDIATVNADGLVTFKSQGKTTIKVTTVDGGLVGEVQVQTTWDTSALEEAILKARAINYQDYEYKYGMMLQDDLAAAESVFNNPDASQEDIDAACTKLQTTISDLEFHKFVLPVVTMTADGKALSNGMTYESIADKLNISVAIAGDMYKTFELVTENENNVTAEISDKKDNILLTKSAETATITINARVVDDYDRETTYTYNITIVNKLIYITSIYMTLDGQKVESVTKSGYKAGLTDFKPFTLSYGVDDIGAAAPVKVEWKSTNPEHVTVDENGVVNLTYRGKLAASTGSVINSNIICTVTNADGSTASVKIPVVIKR
ncbi:Ig-like domain-containing protein [uncultured Eubacterium sp.]|uniref:Ig-like domain-containing protein n=1 Tax=uncultured Eubacterium sp. TaxID=165185 RepID=UPI00260AF134|nr:Ig-like domain-containing protein [uncultured Eubacterium sp.]